MLENNNFNELYEEHNGMVYNLCLKYLQNIEDAEDVTQAVIRDHPAFGKRGLNFTLRIKLHKALHQCPRHGQGRGVKGLAVGVSGARFATDHT